LGALSVSSNVVHLPAAGRKLASWVAGFLEYTDGIQSPEPFRRWAAICAIAGALERKVWIRSQGSDLYPNLYVFLVGPPGLGKSNALHECEQLWRELGTHNVAPVSLTKAAFIDELSRASRVINQTKQINSLLVAVGELGALIPGYDPDFFNALTYLYDGRHYEESRRTIKEPIIIHEPLVNILACCTPSFLTGMMPVQAWEQGFLARVIIIYSDDTTQIKPLDLMDEVKRQDEGLKLALLHDLKEIASETHYRKLQFTQEAANLMNNWHETKGPWSITDDSKFGNGKLSHPRLQHYNTRRTAHLLKLCMIASCDRSNQDHITAEDFRTALNWMFEAEGHMPDIFIAMSSGGDAQVINELYHFIMSYNVKNKGVPIPSHMVYTFLSDKTSANSVTNIISVMERSDMIKSTVWNGLPAFLANNKGI